MGRLTPRPTSPGSSLPTDGAVQTLLARKGVCRDYAHLVIALLRALDVPARLVSVYAPGLSPMDFHAVAEANLDGAVVRRRRDHPGAAHEPRPDRHRAGRLRHRVPQRAPRYADLDELEVTAVADVLPDDDVRDLVTLG